MRQSFPDARFSDLAVPLDLAHQHGPLHSGDAKIRQLVLLCVFREPGLGLLPDVDFADVELLYARGVATDKIENVPGGERFL